MLRDAWKVKSASWEGRQLIFIDESAANERTADRKYGWAPVGVTTEVFTPLRRSERWSILPVYTADGFIEYEIAHTGWNTEMFNNFVRYKVLPLCNPYPGVRSILIMDNCKIHHSEVHTTSPSLADNIRSLWRCAKRLECSWSFFRRIHLTSTQLKRLLRR
jgi:hypothetical protein